MQGESQRSCRCDEGSLRPNNPHKPYKHKISPKPACTHALLLESGGKKLNSVPATMPASMGHKRLNKGHTGVPKHNCHTLVTVEGMSNRLAAMAGG